MMSFKNMELNSALISLLVAIGFSVLSFYDTDPEVYLFPRIIAVAFLGFSIVLLFTALKSQKNDSASSTDGDEENCFITVLPGLIVGIIYLLTMDIIGFYVTSYCAFLAFLIIYGKRKATDVPAFIKKSLVAACFIGILYLLFWQGLNVRTPTGWIF